MSCAKLSCHNSEYCSQYTSGRVFHTTCTTKKWNGEKCDSNANGGLDVSCYSNYCNWEGVCAYRAPDSSQANLTDTDAQNDAADAEVAHESDATATPECVDYKDEQSCTGDDNCSWADEQCSPKAEL